MVPVWVRALGAASGSLLPSTSVRLRSRGAVGTAACHRSFRIGCEAAGADGVGAREPHVASGGPLLWRPRLGLSGRAAPCVLKPPGTPDSRLGTAGPGDRSRRAAVTELCSHEGAASTTAVPGPWNCRHPGRAVTGTSSAVGSQGSPKAPGWPSGPALPSPTPLPRMPPLPEQRR